MPFQGVRHRSFDRRAARKSRRGNTSPICGFAELSVIEHVASLYRPDSQICHLNREGSLRDPHPYLVDLLQQAQAMSEASGGAFDITVQPLWDLSICAMRFRGALRFLGDETPAHGGVHGCYQREVRFREAVRRGESLISGFAQPGMHARA